MHVLIEARRAAPAVLYLPHLQLWWETTGAALQATLRMLLADLPPDLPLLLLAVADCRPEARPRQSPPRAYVDCWPPRLSNTRQVL